MAARRLGIIAGQAHVARISVNGFIAGNQRMADLMERVGKASSVSGVVISINSPGGTTTGSEELFRNIRALSAKKPLVAFVDGTAASGGYITAIAADHIVARETSLVGSIGVLFQYPDLSGLLSQVGVKVEEVKSAPLKAEPSPFKPTSPEARAALESVVRDTYDWFKRLVRERRGMSESELATVSTGQIFSGHQGVAHEARGRDRRGARRDGLAGSARRAFARICRFATGSRAATATFRCIPWAATGADLFGLDGVGEAFRRAAAGANAAQLDGLLAVWQPSEK